MTDEQVVASIRSQLVGAVRPVRSAEAALVCRRSPTREAELRNAEKWKWTVVNVLYGYPEHYRGFAAELDEAEKLAKACETSEPKAA